VIPDNNLISTGIPEEEELVDTGAISRPRVEFQGEFQGEQVTQAVLNAQSIVAGELIGDDDTSDWVVHQIGDDLVLPSEYEHEFRTLRTKLANVLPVPTGDVGIEDILRFKEERADELSALHHYLEEVYLDAIENPDSELAERSAIRDLEEAIGNIHEVNNEAWDTHTSYDLSVTFNLDVSQIAQGGFMGALFEAYAGGQTAPLGAVAGGLASTLSIEAQLASSFEPSEGETKLSYLASAHEEDIV